MCIIKMDFSLSNTYMVLCAVSFSQTYGSSYFIRVFAFVTLCLRRDSKWRTIKVNFPGKLARNCCRRQAPYVLPTELPFPSSSSFADISITRPHPWYSKRQGFHYLFFCPPTFLLREISPHLTPDQWIYYFRKYFLGQWFDPSQFLKASWILLQQGTDHFTFHHNFLLRLSSTK